ncbi:hypothetical protein Krac_12459 [Ktedonobacter racemifer DSM 44963]|uniref:Uncharacterized protein n=1 Tax=Ktedonobacter racemifer DSM 44963 TaxID=485913 RepID=D6TH76_KTERA|nr:hypothetical protein Krac_12459 [Ktedonobacter racemifer DSM 44963]
MPAKIRANARIFAGIVMYFRFSAFGMYRENIKV